MTISVQNPDQYMASLRQIIAQGLIRVGLLVGAGAPAGIFTSGSDKPLIPAVERTRVAFFDGFTGSSEPFLDPTSVATNDLPARWKRMWKLHGSLGWATKRVAGRENPLYQKIKKEGFPYGV